MWFDWLREYGSRLIGRLRGPRFEAEMDEELQFHVDMQTEQYVKAGLSSADARRRALLEFGGFEQTREECRDAMGVRLVNDLVNDLRYAARTLIRSPGFTLVAVLTLALGIGANTAVFSVVHSLLLQPLPFAEPDRLVMLWERNIETGLDQDLVAMGDLLDWEEQCQTIEEFGFAVNQSAASRNFMLRTSGNDTRIRGRHVSSGLFNALGISPQLGQVFDEGDDRPGGFKRVILSYRLWKQAFGGDPNILGRTIDVGRTDLYEVIGVMPPSFQFPQDADIWLSFGGWMTEKEFERGGRRRDYHRLWVVGRIKDGVSVGEVQADLNAIQRQIADDPVNQGMARLASEVVVTPILDQVNGQETRPALLLILGAVGFVLLIACVNVANLLLARAISRRREVAIRVALGAGRFRVIRQLLTESLLLSILGAGAGVLLAIWGVQLLDLIRTDANYLGVKSFRFDRFDSVGVNWSVMAFTLIVSITTGVLFGLIPAIQASRLNINAALKEDSRSGTPGRGTRWIRNSLLISEVALALILMAGAGAAIRGFSRMLSVDVGMQPENTLRAELDLEMATKLYGLEPEAAYEEVLSRLSGLPGVVSVSGCGEVPLVKSGWNDTFRILGSDHDKLNPAQIPSTDVRVMGPGAFSTLGIPIKEGRDFNDTDDRTSPNVTVINAAFKEQFFPDESPLGKVVQMRGWQGHEKTVVGVVGSVRNFSGESVDQPELYFPFKQAFMAGSEVGPVILVRVQGNPDDLIPAIQHELDGPEPAQQVLIRFATMDSILAMSASTERFQTTLLSCFAAVALLLAMIGVYGVMAYSTSQRFREFGIRIALGAQPRQILWSIVTQCALMCLIGIAIGVGVTVIVGRVLSSMFFGLDLLDPLLLTGVSVILLLVGVMAGLIPGWNAMRVDPLTALRHE
ncbi:MAG: ABC transporter permease [Planctomycetaceae bacterium]|nr:ABC transporter permease [Planctomycetaceae bacterium]